MINCAPGLDNPNPILFLKAGEENNYSPCIRHFPRRCSWLCVFPRHDLSLFARATKGAWKSRNNNSGKHRERMPWKNIKIGLFFPRRSSCSEKGVPLPFNFWAPLKGKLFAPIKTSFFLKLNSSSSVVEGEKERSETLLVKRVVRLFLSRNSSDFQRPQKTAPIFFRMLSIGGYFFASRANHIACPIWIWGLRHLLLASGFFILHARCILSWHCYAQSMSISIEYWQYLYCNTIESISNAISYFFQGQKYFYFYCC